MVAWVRKLKITFVPNKLQKSVPKRHDSRLINPPENRLANNLPEMAEKAKFFLFFRGNFRTPRTILLLQSHYNPLGGAVTLRMREKRGKGVITVGLKKNLKLGPL